MDGRIDIDEIVELDGAVGIAGAIRGAAGPGDGMFEQIVDIVVLIYEGFAR